MFDKVQARLTRKAHAHGADKAFVPYLLQGKAFCGICGAPLFGESGRSHTGTLHSYYACYNRKRTHTCQKKNERREALESYLVRQTIAFVLTPSRMRDIARAVVAEYDREFSDSRVSDYEKALQKIDRELEKLVDALIDAPKVAHQKIYDRMEQLEAQKQEYETESAKLRVAMSIRLSEDEVIAWLKTYTTGDPDDPAFRQRLVETFINSVYLDEHRVIVFYNIRANNQVAYPALTETLENKEYPNPVQGSDINSSGGPYNSTSEPVSVVKANPQPHYIFVSGVFGCVFYSFHT